MTKLFVIAFTIFSFVGSFESPAFSQTKAAPKKNIRAAGAKKTTRAAASSSTSSRARATSTNRRRVGSAGSVSTGSAKGATSADGVTSCQVAFTECMDMQIADVIARYPYINNDPAVQAIQETGDELRCIYYSLGNVEKLFGGKLTDKYCTSEELASRTNIKLATKVEDATKIGRLADKTNEFNNLNVCSNQKDFNDLYFSYNYYCDLNTSNVGTRGIPINKCNLKQSSAGIGVTESEKNDDTDKTKITTTITIAPGGKTASASKNDIFATKDSYAYYAEALNRVENDELKIINFEESNLFKNKIKGMNLENWDMMSLRTKGAEGTDSVNDLISDLGLTNTGGLFSINVAPPVGAGNLDPAAIFRKASDICFSGVAQRPKGKTLTDRESKLNTAITKLNSCKTGSIVRDDAERYYLAGTVVKPCTDDYYFNSATNKCIKVTDNGPPNIIEPFKVEDFASGDNPDVELGETDFLSAKKSCDLYENTLISTRNDVYGKFDTAIVGFIEDQVAKLIKKKSKDLNTIASAFQSLEQTDADISISSTKAKLEVFKTKSDAQIQRINTEANLTLAQKDAYTTQINANQELAKLFLSTYEKQILKACNDSLYTQLKPAGYTGKFVVADELLDLANGIDDTFYLNKDGNIKETCAKKKDETDTVVADCFNPKIDKDFVEVNCSSLSSFTQTTRSKVTLPTAGGILPVGIYELDMSGAGGGTGGSYECFGWNRSRDGGRGELRKLLLIVFEPTKYNISIGRRGNNGGNRHNCSTSCGGSGSDGGNSVLTLDGAVNYLDGLSVTAFGGTTITAKGGSKSAPCCSNSGGGCEPPEYSGKGSDDKGWINVIKIK